MSSSFPKSTIQLKIDSSSSSSKKTIESTAVENQVDFKYNIDDLVPAQNCAGGVRKDCVDFVKDISNVVESSPDTIGMNMEKLVYDIRQNIEQNPFRIKPTNYKSFEELCVAVRGYLSEWESFSDGFMDQVMRYARLMANPNQPFPIDFFNLSYEQYIYHMKWYKDNYYDPTNGKNFYSLKHRKDTVSAFLLSYGYNPRIWHYKLPHRPKRKHRHIPPPDIVHDIINFKFFPDDTNRTMLLQYIHAHNFWIGPRPPSELCLLTIDSFNWDEGYIDATEQKTHFSIRTIYPENAIMTGKTRKSFKNYVDFVRPKFESQYSKNSLYITTEGKPFTPRYLGGLLGKTGKMVYPLYQPYSARHWCATARLIKAWIERDPDPIDVVWHFMGHEDRSTTEGYINQARVLFKKYPYDWIKRTLKFPKILKEESALKSKQRQKTPVSSGKSGEVKSGPAEI